MEIRDTGSNPLIILSPDEVVAWLRERADAAGYADRDFCGVQINVQQAFAAGRTYHYEPPTLIAMVSNIKNSRR